MAACGKHLLSTYCVLHPCLGARDTAVTKTDPAPPNQCQRQKGHPCPMIRATTGMLEQLGGHRVGARSSLEGRGGLSRAGKRRELKAEQELEIRQKYETGKSTLGRRKGVCKGPGASGGNSVWPGEGEVVGDEGGEAGVCQGHGKVFRPSRGHVGSAEEFRTGARVTLVQNHLGIKLSCDPAILLVGTSPKGRKIRIRIGVWTLMFVAAGFTISRRRKPPDCPLPGGRAAEGHPHAGTPLGLKGNGVLAHGTTWMSRETSRSGNRAFVPRKDEHRATPSTRGF